MTPSPFSPFEPAASLPASVEGLAAAVEARGSVGSRDSAVELLLQPPAAGLPDRWYVSDGSHTVGPVDFNLLVRGVRSGAVGHHCWLRNEGWRVWRRVAEFVRAPAPRADALRNPVAPTAQSAAVHAAAQRAASQRAATPLACVPKGFHDDDGESTLVDALRDQPRATEAASFEPLLGGAIMRMAAEACLVIEVGDQGGVVRAARGSGSLDVLGEYIPSADPLLIAAASGAMVVAEPRPGPVGDVLLARLARAGCPGAGALMVPVFSRGRRPHLAGVLEVGRTQPFSPAEIAEAVALADQAAGVFDRLPPTLVRTLN